MGAALALVLLLADGTDQEFLAGRLSELEGAYEKLASRQTAQSIRQRALLLREIAHLPFDGDARINAGKFLARVVAQDRNYRIRAEAARAIGRVGTGNALLAMYRTLFGAEGRGTQFEFLHAVLPEALARLRHPDDMEWLSRRILQPILDGRETTLARIAGPLRGPMVVMTIEGVGRARARALGPEMVGLARSKDLQVRVAALRALAALGLGDAVARASLGESDARARAAAAIHPGLAPPVLRAALFDEAPLVRRAAIRGLSARGSKGAITLLIERLPVESVSAVRLDLLDTLNQLTGKDFGADAELWSQWWAANEERFDGPGAREEKGRTYFFDVGLRTERVTFVIDVSASMSREDARNVSRKEHAARELGKAISKLRPNVQFALYTFSSTVGRHPKGSVGMLPSQAGWATRTFRDIRPAGATNTYAALMQALADPFRPDTIVLLSDGNPYRCSYQGKNYSEHEQILAEVRRANLDHEIRIHAVALLSGVSTDSDKEDASSAAEFLRRLAQANRGEFREVR